MDPQVLAKLGEQKIKEEMRFRWFGFKIPVVIAWVVTIVLLLYVVVTSLYVLKTLKIPLKYLQTYSKSRHNSR